ncbi:hypothetical protein AAG906_006637 [Vitis piasezkii]
MPRPGPRPYECVRRAWHSDRHQPIRGSLIQEIFRVVNEIHSSATKKNKEWQEKLPIVVLKAEEIMYSKANSEAEYMDLKTLWDRANDAINTIIRRDESTETGEFLQPCIEASLNLGCPQRRASRSQRNNNPRCYLTPSTQEPISISPSILENSPQGNHATISQVMSRYATFIKPSSMSVIQPGLEPHSTAFHNNDCPTSKFLFSSENCPPSGNKCLQMEVYPASNLCAVYPLYDGNQLQCEESQCGFGVQSHPKSNPMEPAGMGTIQNLFSYAIDPTKKPSQTDFGHVTENSPKIDCDLSLRLGPLSIPCVSVENSWPQEFEDVGSSCSREGSKFSDLSPQVDKQFPFFPRGNTDDPLDSCLSKRSSEGENLNMEATMRKRKAVISYPLEDRQFCCQPKLPYNYLPGRMRNAGS